MISSELKGKSQLVANDTVTVKLTEFINKASYAVILIGLTITTLAYLFSLDDIYIGIGLSVSLMFVVMPILNKVNLSIYACAYLLTIGPLWQAILSFAIGGHFGQEAMVIGNVIITGVVFYHFKSIQVFLWSWNALMYIIPQLYLSRYDPFFEKKDYLFDDVLVTFFTMAWAAYVVYMYVKDYNILLNKSKEQVSLISESKKDLEMFTKLIAHDLRSPLRHAKSFVKLADDALEQNDIVTAKEHLKSADLGAQEIKTLVEDITLIVNLKEKENYDLKQLDLSKLINTIVASKQVQLVDRSIILNNDVSTKILGDEQELRLMLSQIIHNAIKYNSNDEIVLTIWEQSEREYLNIFIKDNGIGIEPSYTHTIFNYFEKLHTKTKYNGSGLGLPVAKKIAMKHRGNISLQESSSSGSTFMITFPKDIVST